MNIRHVEMIVRSLGYAFLVSLCTINQCAQDSMGASRGNWRKKSEWRSEAKTQNEAIKPLVDKINAGREPFDQKVHALQTLLTDFYTTKKIDATASKSLVASVQAYLDALIEQEKEMELARDPDVDVTEIVAVKNLEQLKIDTQTMGALLDDLEGAKAAINGFVAKYDEIQKQAEASIAKGNELFADIDQIYDHLAAQQQYYAIKALVDTLTEQVEYLQGVFNSSFDALTDAVKERIDKLNVLIEQLEAQQIFIMDRNARVALKAEQDQLRAQEQIAHAAALAQSEKPWYVRLWNAMLSLFSFAK